MLFACGLNWNYAMGNLNAYLQHSELNLISVVTKGLFRRSAKDFSTQPMQGVQSWTRWR